MGFRFRQRSGPHRYGDELWAETQLHFGDLNLDDYQVLILGPHPEYWFRKMYYELKDWVFNRGGLQEIY